MAGPSISHGLLQAYRSTTYCVFANSGTVALRIGECSETLLALHSAAGVASSAFVTACNPFGEVQSDAHNAVAMQSLKLRLDAAGISWIDGEGRGDDASWAPEPSLLVLGVDEADARDLCVALRQNAVVVIPNDGIPELLLHPGAVIVSAVAGADT